MLFGLLIVLPITIIVWFTLRLFGKRVHFERLHEGVGLLIIGALLAVFLIAIIGAVLLQIWWHLWVLLILVPLSIIVSVIDARETRTRLRQRDPGQFP